MNSAIKTTGAGHVQSWDFSRGCDNNDASVPCSIFEVVILLHWILCIILQPGFIVLSFDFQWKVLNFVELSPHSDVFLKGNKFRRSMNLHKHTLEKPQLYKIIFFNSKR